MRRILIATGLLSSLSLLGCASPQNIRAGAREHERKAAYYEGRGDYYRAAAERDKALRQYRKAANRQSYWYYY
jgi:hypothetical protein